MASELINQTSILGREGGKVGKRTGRNTPLAEYLPPGRLPVAAYLQASFRQLQLCSRPQWNFCRKLCQEFKEIFFEKICIFKL
jgi:hypothetical protein